MRLKEYLFIVNNLPWKKPECPAKNNFPFMRLPVKQSSIAFVKECTKLQSESTDANNIQLLAREVVLISGEVEVKSASARKKKDFHVLGGLKKENEALI